MKLSKQQQEIKAAALKSLRIGNRWPDSVEKMNTVAQWGIQDAEFILACTPAMAVAMLSDEPCEACAYGYRLAAGGLHYNDDRGGATWGVCRKVAAALG